MFALSYDYVSPTTSLDVMPATAMELWDADLVRSQKQVNLCTADANIACFRI